MVNKVGNATSGDWRRDRASAGWRALAALIALVATVGTSVVFLLAALIVATFNCEDGCPSGSPWAPGAWGAIVELWGLAVPAFLAACALVWAVATGRPRASLVTWAAATGLLLVWCVFTGATSISVDFSGTNSHWMWLAGLLLAGGGGLIAVGVVLFGQRTPRRYPPGTAAL